MIKVKNADQFFGSIDSWLDEVEHEYMQIAISLMWIMTGEALKRSPQYSGDFVANWKLAVNKYSTTFREGIFPDKQFPAEHPFQRMDAQPILYAIDANKGALNTARLGDTLWLSNSAMHHDLYAWKLEDGLIRLRPVNYGGEGPLRQVRELMKAQFGRIDKQTMEFLK